MKHLRVPPVGVKALTGEQLAPDAGPAADLGVPVITRDDLDDVQNELVRFPDAGSLFDRALRVVQDRQSARKAHNGEDRQPPSLHVRAERLLGGIQRESIRGNRRTATAAELKDVATVADDHARASRLFAPRHGDGG